MGVPWIEMGIGGEKPKSLAEAFLSFVNPASVFEFSCGKEIGDFFTSLFSPGLPDSLKSVMQ
jgi:hypothetical protein